MLSIRFFPTYLSVGILYLTFRVRYTLSFAYFPSVQLDVCQYLIDKDKQALSLVRDIYGQLGRLHKDAFNNLGNGMMMMMMMMKMKKNMMMKKKNMMMMMMMMKMMMGLR